MSNRSTSKRKLRDTKLVFTLRKREILQEKQACYPDRLFWYTGENMGVGGSFMDCLYAAVEKHSDADYFALADQDDYWLEQKLARGIQKLEQMPVGLKISTKARIAKVATSL